MTAQVHPWRYAVGVGVLALGLGLGLVGCSRSGSTTSADHTAGQAGGSKADAGPAANGDLAQPAPAAVPTGAVPAPLASNRDLIYTGSLTVRVSDVSVAADRIAALATSVGGYISSDERRTGPTDSGATIEMRIPAVQIGGVLDTVSHMGTELDREVSTKDVTAQMVDINSRILTEQASVTRVRALLAKAQSLSDVTQIEGELTKREADLESLQAQLRDLSDLVTLSTLTVNLLGPDTAAPRPAKHKNGFVAGLKSGWRAFLGFLQGALTVIGAMLPFLVAFGIPAWALAWWLRRRVRRNRAARASRSGPPSAGLPIAPPPLPAPGPGAAA